MVEAANGPTTPGGDAVLRERGIEVLPDIYTNGGARIRMLPGALQFFELEQSCMTSVPCNPKIRSIPQNMGLTFGSLVRRRSHRWVTTGPCGCSGACLLWPTCRECKECLAHASALTIL